MDNEKTPETKADEQESAVVIEAVEPQETPKPKAPVASTPASSIEHGSVVSMSAIVAGSNSRNSSSVRLVQRRLIELGHMGAGSDLPGWLSNGTLDALAEYMDKARVKASSETDHAVIESLMKGTPAKVTK